MAGTISTVTNGVLTGRLHRGVMADPIPDYVIPGTRSTLSPTYDGLVVSVAPGTCVIGGCIVDFPLTEQVAITPVTGQKGYIVARLNLTAGTATIVQVQGAAPSITVDSLVSADTGIRDMILAYYTTSSSAITSFADRRQIGQNVPNSVISTAAAAASDKGAFPGCLYSNSIIEINFSNGNTATYPIITIGAETYSLDNIPTIAPVAGGTQSYRFKKTGPGTLTLMTLLDYKVESGVVDGWAFERWASGKSVCHGLISVTVANTATFITGLYMGNGTAAIPAGIFNATPEVYAGYSGASTITGALFGYRISSTSFGIQTLRNSSSGFTVTVSVECIGTWK